MTMSPSPSIHEFFNAWCQHHGDPVALLSTLNVTPSRLLELIGLPEFAAMTAAWHKLQLDHTQWLARSFRISAGSTLRELLNSTDPVERRRTATALSRLADSLDQGPARRSRRTNSAAPSPAATAPTTAPAAAPATGTTAPHAAATS
ncbi:MAG: hypothetical protein AABZ53_16120, partial [Planctomycetota bacterium]